MKNYFNKTQRGFSLVELSVAMGMMGVLTTVILNLSQQQVGLEKRAETSGELGLFHAGLLENFNDKRSCENTLNQGTTTTPLPNISNNMEIIDIRDNASGGGAILYSKDHQFGKVIDTTTNEKTFKIKSINLNYNTTLTLLTAPNYKTSASLNIIYEVSPRLTAYEGNREKVRVIPLGDIELTQNGANYTLRNCAGNTVSITVNPRQLCDSVAGVYDTGIAGSDKCRLSRFFDYDSGVDPQQICSSTNNTYCVTAWSITTFNDRQGASAHSLVNYAQQVYGLGTTPNTTNLFLGNKAGGYSTASSTGNTFIGKGAGMVNTSGSNNIMIGGDISTSINTGITATGNRQINIGDLLIGRMPSNTAGSPSINSFGTENGLVINGELNLRSGIKIGTTTLLCNSSSSTPNDAGMIRLNGNDLQFCNGRAWVALQRLAVIYIWVAPANNQGNLGGVSGADGICQTNAPGAGLPLPVATYTHKALIGATGASPRNPRNLFSSSDTRPIRRPDGTLVSNNWARFFNTSFNLSAAVRNANVALWTGLDDDGNVGSNTCNNWTINANTHNGITGRISTFRNRIFDEITLSCSTVNTSIYCISY